MREMKKSLINICLPLFAFVICFLAFSVKAEAKNVSDLLVQYPNNDIVYTNGTRLIILKEGFTLEGYDLNGYDVYIAADKVTVKKCSNITYVTIPSGKKNVVISGNTIIGSTPNGVIVYGEGAKVTGNTITGTTSSGILVQNNSNCEISKNKISGNDGGHSIYVKDCKNITLSENTVSNSLHYGMSLIGDTNSVVKKNIVKNSARDITQLDIIHGDGILLDEGCKGTQLIENTVDNVGSREAHYGNGIIVGHDCADIVLKGNNVTNAGWYGIQITYASQNITLENNTVDNSRSDGISISRDSYANLKGNKLYGNIGYGIVYDGEEHNPNKVRVKGTAEKNECYTNIKGGIFVTEADVTISNNNIHDNYEAGIRIEKSSTTKITSNTLKDNSGNTGLHLLGSSKNNVSSNYIYKSSPDINSVGIRLEESAQADLSGNRIANYGESAVFAGPSAVVTMKNNQASIARKEGFKEYSYAYFISESTGSDASLHNHLHVREITTTGVKGQTHYLGYTSGAVVDGKLYSAKSQEIDSQTNISVTFPQQSNTDKIVLFTVDNKGNSICINAPADFVLTLGKDESEEQVRAFVVRFYKEVLGRSQSQIDADKDGINGWTSQLMSGEKTGAEVAYGFVNSAEFRNRDLNNDQFVNTMYMSFFNRQPDAGGYAGWYNDLQNGSKTRLQVLEGFTSSAEFKNLCAAYGINPGVYTAPAKPQDPVLRPLNVDTSGVDDAQLSAFVERLYDKALSRPSDDGGKAYWKGCILNGSDANGNVYDIRTVISKGFLNSQEYKNRDRNNAEFVADCYAAFFNRDPRGTDDEPNYWNWVKELNNGMSRQQLIENGFGNSKEFMNLIQSYGFKIQ